MTIAIDHQIEVLDLLRAGINFARFDSLLLDDELRVQHFYNELDALMR